MSDRPGDRVFNPANPTLTRARERLEPGRTYQSLVEVRMGVVRAFLDGDLATEWRTDFSGLENQRRIRLRNLKALGGGCFESRVIFGRVEVR